MKYALILLTALAANGCKDNAAETQTDTSKVEANNTGKNERDRDNTKTPGDQSESESDRKITQEIRQSVVASEALSVGAKNVKIITADGVVTLRGPVKSQEERTEIAAIAKKADGAKRVDNQLELETN